jgi:transglutaminase-like putative cysteine protease
VFESFNEVRLQPMGCAEQICLDFELVIEPPATVVSFRDYYGNAVHGFGALHPHDRLVIKATCDVITHAGADDPLAGPRDGEPDASPLLRELAEDPAFADEFAEFLAPSAYVVLDDASAELAGALIAERADLTAYGFFMRSAAWVRERLEYRIGTTTVESSVAEVLAGGAGVCQDFAHVLISLCRHAGLPARYVSGYMGSVAEATASHAWVEAYMPPYGWLGVDATSGHPCTGRHVKVGVGRDYADVAVLRGTYKGGGEATLEVRVTSETLDGTDAVAGVGAVVTPTYRRLVSTQNLAAMRQFQSTPAIAAAAIAAPPPLTFEQLAPPRIQTQPVDEVPKAQPRQQQQFGGARCACA